MNKFFNASILVCAIGSGLFLTACGGDDTADALNIASPKARLVNALPAGPSLKLYRDSVQQTDAGTPAFGQASDYFDTVSTTSTWTVNDASAGTQIGSTSLAASGSTRYTFFAFPGAGTLVNLLSYSDPYDVSLGNNNARIRFANGAPNDGTFDVYVTAPGSDLNVATATFTNVAYETVIPASGTNSSTLATGTYQLRLTPAGTKTVFFTGAFTAGNNDDILMVTLPNSATEGDVKVLEATAGQGNVVITNGAI